MWHHTSLLMFLLQKRLHRGGDGGSGQPSKGDKQIHQHPQSLCCPYVGWEGVDGAVYKRDVKIVAGASTRRQGGKGDTENQKEMGGTRSLALGGRV